ncbi:hypothetical protein UFOVP724_113 [uncultured Caudovirales phage]|uniref:Uncharacterized protein n=1 Tax=uncultured Caudovirales phage TaxID=2100421 RepID=A0A6J5NSY5_9CAUD|nr:hypothetical protein UFOVP724_113 [uncultured Caudovirales phage]
MDGDIMTWLNITEEQQLYDSLNVDIVRTYNESPNGYSKNSTTWNFLSGNVALNQRKLNTAAPEITTGTTNTYAIIKFTSPIARSINKSDIKTVAGQSGWLIINESATTDVPLIDRTSFDFAQYFYFLTINFTVVYDVNFSNGGSMTGSPFGIIGFKADRTADWTGATKWIGYDDTQANTKGLSNIILPTSNVLNSASWNTVESGYTFSCNLETVTAAWGSGVKHIGFVFDASKIQMAVANFRWIIDKVQLEIKRVKK